MKIAVIGAGNIAPIYLHNLTRYEDLEVIGVADLDLERAKDRAAEYGIANAWTPQELFESDAELVVNLTVPQAHFTVARQALETGKHVYNEKPLALAREEGAKLLALAAENNLRVGCAPDTFLGASHQACRRVIDEGLIGRPVAAEGFMLCRGHESWHPSPEFYYKKGGGPLFDMGPYYLTALINLLGPIQAVTGSARTSFTTRTIASEPLRGHTIEVDTPTHIAAVLEFESGPIATLTMSFDVFAHKLPSIQIHGEEGSLIVPDPNGFGGEVLLRNASSSEWDQVPMTGPYFENCRGIGVREMAAAIRRDTPHLASGGLGFHVLDTMHAILDAADSRTHVPVHSGLMRPGALPATL